MSLALLAVSGILLAVASILAPLFAAWAAARRLLARHLSPTSPAQQRIDLAILLLALLGPAIWLEWFLLLHHPRGPLSFVALLVILLLGAASLLLALLGRGPGRAIVLAAFATLLLTASGLLLWAAVSVHHHRGEAFVGKAISPPPANHFPPATSSNPVP